MKKQFVSLVAMALLLAGCDGNTAKALKAFGESCQGAISAELHASAYGNDLTLKCDNFRVLADKK